MSQESPLTEPYSIVIVHGLKGHPYKTWTSAKTAGVATAQPSSSDVDSLRPSEKKSRFRSSLGAWLGRTSSIRSEVDKKGKTNSFKSESSVIDPEARLFWPADLLPEKCPQARILTYGYDTKITKYLSGPTNKSSIFSHSKDLLFALGRQRLLDRPVIYVAHSLGGIVIKEVSERVLLHDVLG